MVTTDDAIIITELEAHDPLKWWILILAASLAILSAFFSGLTLGLMTQDLNTLEVLAESGDALKYEYEEMESKHYQLYGRSRVLNGVRHNSTPSILDIVSFDEMGGSFDGERGSVGGSDVANEDRLVELRRCMKNAKYAKRILRIRKDGNLLLVTLLVGNVSVNSAFSIVMGDMTSSMVGFAISTVIITLFGEIAPQAICSRYGLIVGYYAVPVLRPIIYLLYVVCKPIALILDCILGKEAGQTFNRDELRTYINNLGDDMHFLKREEANWISSVLYFAKLKAEDYMVPMSEVFVLSSSDKLTTSLMEAIVRSGYSRVPVLENRIIIGIIYVKDLVAVPRNSNPLIKDIMTYFNKPLSVYPSDIRLDRLFTIMRDAHCHMAILTKRPEDRSLKSADGSQERFHAGIITLEDIIEVLLHMDIKDEYDNSATDLTQMTSRHRRDSCIDLAYYRSNDWTHTSGGGMECRDGPAVASIRLFGVNRAEDVINGSPNVISYEEEEDDTEMVLSDREVEAAFAFLRFRKIEEFQRDAIDDDNLVTLLSRSLVVSRPCRGESPKSMTSIALITHGEICPPFLMVLSGSMSVYSGSEKFKCTMGPWDTVGAKFLSSHASSDFDAKIDKYSKDKTRILTISSQEYRKLRLKNVLEM